MLLNSGILMLTSKTKGLANVTDTVINVTEWLIWAIWVDMDIAYKASMITYRSVILWWNANDFLDNLLSPLEFGHQLFIGEGGHVAMRPSVHGDFMAGIIGTLEQLRELLHLTTHHVKGDLFVFLIEVIVQCRAEFGWAIIKGDTPFTSGRASINIFLIQALSSSPQAMRIVFRILRQYKTCNSKQKKTMSANRDHWKWL